MHRTALALFIGSAMTAVTLGPAPVTAQDRGEPAVVALFVLLAAAMEKQKRETPPARIAPDQAGDRQAFAAHQDRGHLASRRADDRDHATGYR